MSERAAESPTIDVAFAVANAYGIGAYGHECGLLDAINMAGGPSNVVVFYAARVWMPGDPLEKIPAAIDRIAKQWGIKRREPNVEAVE